MVYANASHAAVAHAAPHHRLDAIRITAGAGAIATNAAVLLLMLAPMAIPELRPSLPVAQDIVWIPKTRPTPAPPPPIEVPVKPVQAAVRTTTPARPNPITAPPARVSPLEGDTQATPAAEDATHDTLGGDDDAGHVGQGDVLTGAVLQYASAPPPAYPREALRAGVSGTVVLEVLVGVDGRPISAEVLSSSGYRVLDLAARRQVLARWVFKPAVHAGVPVQAIGRVPVEFRLAR